MKTCRQLKTAARGNLIGNYRITMGAFVIVMLLGTIIEIPFSRLVNGAATPTTNYIIYYIAEFLIAILSGVLQIGLFRIHLSIARKKECKVSDVFCCFKSRTDRYILGYLLVFAFSLIGMSPAAYVYFFCDLTTANIPIIIGLLVLSLVLSVFINIIFSLVFFVMLDNEDLSIMQCFKKAVGLMKGNKGRLFYIYLSFVGMWFLVVLSFGIGYLWVEPYMIQTYTMFYLDVIGEEPAAGNPTAGSIIDVNITN